MPSKAGKGIKLIFKIIGSIAALVIIGVVLLLVFFPTEKVKQIAIEQMQKRFNRQVTIGNVSLNLFKGIVIEKVAVSDRPNFKKGTFLTCKAFVFQYDLWQLLYRRLVIKKLTIEKPEINIKRYLVKKEAVFNFSDMLPPVPKKQPVQPKTETAQTAVKPKAAAASMPKVSKGQLPVDLQVGKVGLLDARIRIEDTATPRFNEIYELFNVHFIIENIKIYENAPLRIKTGFGLSVTEKKDNVKTDKDINLEAAIDGTLTLFNKSGWLDPNGLFNLALRNGKFHGVQAYEELLSQAGEITGSVNNYQKGLLDSYNKMSKQISDSKAALGQVSSKVQGVSDKAGDLSKKIAGMDMSFIKGALDWKFLSKNFEFDELKTVAKVKDSKVITEDIRIDGKEFKMTGSGYTGFDTRLQYVFTLLADKKYNKNEVTKALANADGNLEFPVQVYNTISDVKVKFGQDNIVKKIQDRLKDKFLSQLKGADGQLSDTAKQYLGKYLGSSASQAVKYLDKKEQEKAIEDAKKLAAQKQAELKKQAEEEARKKEEELKMKAEEEKRKLEEAARKKAEEEAKNKLKKLKF